MQRPLLLLALAALAAAPAHAISAESVVRDHVAAIGGEKRLRTIETTRLSGKFTRADGSTGKLTWRLSTPDRFHSELRDESGVTREAYNGRTGWREDSAGLRTLNADEQAALRFAALVHNGRLVDWKKDKLELSLAGTERASGREAWVVELVAPGGARRRLFIDTQTKYLVQEEQGSGPALVRVRYADHRAVDGVVEPGRIFLSRDGEEIEVALDEVAHGVALPESTFDFPAEATTGMPDLTALLEALEKNQEEVERRTDDYTYDVEHTEITLDGDGNVKDQKVEEYEVYRVRGATVRRLVRKDGRELTEAEEKKASERAEKRVERHDEEEAKRAKQAAKGKGTQDEDELRLSDFLRICRFVNPRHETFGGRQVLVVEFEPRPDYEARSRAEALVQSFVGAIWIDEQAKQIARLEARMVEGFKVGGGMVAKLNAGSQFAFEQALVHDEVWLPKHAEVHMTGRVMLVKGLRVNVIDRFGNYRKFETRAEEAPSPPTD